MSSEFRIDSDVIDALSATLNELSSGLSDTMGECSGRMSSLAKIPGFDSALGEINKQLGEVSNEVMTIGGSISRKTAEIIDHDIQTSKIADQIEVPKGFLANNSITTNYFKNSSLGKTDGTSVNQGAKDTTKQNLEDIEGTKQGLTNIYNENGVVLQDNEDISENQQQEIIDDVDDVCSFKFRVAKPLKDINIVISEGDRIIKTIHKLAIVPSEMEIVKIKKDLFSKSASEIKIYVEEKK